MKKPKIKFTVLKEETGFSAFAENGSTLITTDGDNLAELHRNCEEATNLAFDEQGLVYTSNEFEFEFDLASFFKYYNVINASALSKRLGMSQSLLAQYIKGIKKPSAAQKQRILKEVNKLGRELQEVGFLV